MAYTEGQLSGSADYRCGINVYLVSQNGSNYTSTFYWEVRLVYPGSTGAWFNDSVGSWSAALASGFFLQSGSFARPYANRNDAVQYLAASYFTAGHDAAGNRPGMYNNAYIGTNHASIGSGGSGDAWVDAPRLPVRPTGPAGAPTFDQITANSMRVSWAGATDNGGSGIDQMLLRVSENSNPEVQPFTDYALGAGATSHVLTGLKPNTRYYAKVYSHNAVGYSFGSAVGNALTLAGVYVSNGSAWVATSINASDGSAWSSPLPKISDGDSWENPIDQ